jgi:hypothetical protein
MRGFFGQGYNMMSLNSVSRRQVRATRALCLALAFCAAACGTADPVEEGTAPAGSTGGGPGAGPGAGAGAGGGVGGALDAGGASSMGGGSGGASSSDDGAIQTMLDGGLAIPVEPPKPLADASVSGPPLGNAYAETEYNLERPAALVTAYGVLTAGVGSGTRLFVNHLHLRDAGATVAYGAVDVVDGGMVWQKPPAQPNTFPIGLAGERMFVSNPFKYILEARVPNPLNSASVFRIYLESEQTVWSASFSSDYENIVTGALYGVVTRAHAESRPLSLGALECLAVCTDLGACTTGISTLAGLLDCNDAQLDADVNGDGTNDGYRLIVSFRSRRAAPPAL